MDTAPMDGTAIQLTLDPPVCIAGTEYRELPGWWDRETDGWRVLWMIGGPLDALGGRLARVVAVSPVGWMPLPGIDTPPPK